jgi:hypothetical protein
MNHPAGDSQKVLMGILRKHPGDCDLFSITGPLASYEFLELLSALADSIILSGASGFK